MREIRWLPQEMLDSAADFAGPILDLLLVAVPFLLPFMILGGIGRATLQFGMARNQKEPYLTFEQEKKLRSVPLGFGLWGLIIVHIFMWMVPGTVRWMNSNVGSGMILDVITVFFAFLTLFGVFNLLLRFALDGGIRKKFKIQDFGILHHLMGALGVGIYCWAAIRPASVWTGTIGNQLFSDAWNGKLFDESYTSPAMLMPTMAKLHFILGMTAFGALLHSKLITHLLIPNLKTWGIGGLFDGSGDDRTDAASVAAGLAGVTIEKK
ncbi:MAG: respiratory nitrate reductase subunit gamma [Planctomycetota bacterium]